jgi:serine/threonine-protein kinase
VVAGLLLVPPQYLAPERVAGYRATVRSDVYGLGVLLFELLTGSPPFLGRDHDETRDLHLTSPMPKLPGRVAAWDPVLRRCLEKEPEDRYGSMAEVRAEVLALAQPLRRPGPKVAPRSGLCARTPAPTPAVPVHDASCGSPPRAPEPETLEPGATLGSYRLEALLGEGGMGQVFVATHRTLGRRVAIKVLKAELAADPAQVSRFVQEAQAVNRVRHPNIVEVHDLVQEPAEAGGRIYFVMELLEGESLRRLSRKTPFELRRALRLVRQAADALAAAHDVGVVHRDVKPDNLFVVRDEAGAERVKVLDFGVARVRDASRGDLRTTRTGQVVGTPLWMAPEQILGRDVDARADIYSLMMVLYVLLVRRFPFDGASMSDVVMQRLEREAKAIGAHTSLGEPVPKALEQLLAECLSRDRSKRPGSMAEVAERLRDIEAGLSTHVTSPFDAQASPRRTWARWVALGAAGGGLAGLAARYWL